MVYREVSMIEIREALRAWLAGKSERAVAAQAGVDRKTSKRYVSAAVAAGLSRGGGENQLTDGLIGHVVSVVRPVRPDGHGQGWAELEARREQIATWAEDGVPVVKIGILLARQGVVVAERTLHRFVAERCAAPGSKVTTRVDDGPPGGELQVDFGDLGLIPAGESRRRKLRALVFTACFSRYMFVYLTFSMTLEEVIAGCEEAWQFFSGVFRVIVPDNMSPVVAKADAVNPRLTREWLEYCQARGFVTDPARVRHPRDKPRRVTRRLRRGPGPRGWHHRGAGSQADPDRRDAAKRRDRHVCRRGIAGSHLRSARPRRSPRAERLAGGRLAAGYGNVRERRARHEGRGRRGRGGEISGIVAQPAGGCGRPG